MEWLPITRSLVLCSVQFEQKFCKIMGLIAHPPPGHRRGFLLRASYMSLLSTPSPLLPLLHHPDPIINAWLSLWSVRLRSIYLCWIHHIKKCPSGQPNPTTASFYGLGEQCVRHHFLWPVHNENWIIICNVGGGHHLKGAGVEGYVTFLVHFLIPLSAWGRSGVKDPD